MHPDHQKKEVTEGKGQGENIKKHKFVTGLHQNVNRDILKVFSISNDS